MVSRLGALALSLVLAVGAALPAAAAELPAFLWQITLPGAAHADYLYGTMHVPLPPGRSLPDVATQALLDCDTFMMEVDNSQVSPATIAKYAAIASGQDLSKLLDKGVWAKLVAQMKPKGFDAERLRSLDPWFVGLMYIPTPPEGAVIIDDRLLELAKVDSKRIAYLETLDEQLAALDSVAMKEDIEQLKEAILDPKRVTKETVDLEKAYLAGDLKTVETYLFDKARMKSYPDFYKKLFDDRNRRWMPKIQALYSGSDAFVAVGLGHLLGPNGLLALLKQAGCTVSRMETVP